ncbi:glycosyltransferase [Priestia aryabhattai]|uniref:glycosyltransferase n=1 Tax=Priestia aryabhattai TaxID=412384 RepID=UPI0026BA6042|nr:glycosyltransferase [Priestia aryabhattai]
MKIVHVGEYAKGGIATYIKELIEFQEKSKNIREVHLLVSETNSDKDFKLPKDKIVFYKYKRNIKSLFKAIRQINAEINRISPDIIHVHSTFAGVFVRLPLFFKKKTYKVIYCSHGWSFLMELNTFKKKIFVLIERILATKTDKIINISPNEQNQALKLGFPSQKSELIANGITPKIRKGLPQLKLNSDKINLLFVGRFDRQKGLDILFSYFENYACENICLYTIGESVLENNEISIPKNISNLGWVDNEHLDSYYEMFDGVIIPSRWEGFGLVAIEAMKNKKPIIVSDRGALPYLIKNNNGYVFSLDDLNTLHKIFNQINKKDLKDKGINGYQYFLNNFTSDIMNEKIVQLYEKLV